MLKRERNGFTLVELLATIAILAIVASFTIYVAINLINSSKEKSYSIAINEVEKNVGSYLIENADKLFYVTDNDKSDIEYQCLTVENLINYGYFKNDILNSKVSSSKTISKSDYVYIERDKKTKSITKSKYILDDENLMKMCNIAVVAVGDISINVEPNTLSAYKDITISYKLKNVNDINNYDYTYSYSNKDVVTVISEELMLKKIRVTDNGTISANIIYTKNNSSISENSKKITDIDKIPPVITIDDDLVKIYGESFDLYEGVTITDNSGVVASKKVYLEGKEITSYSGLLLGDNVVTYKAIDKFDNMSEVKRKITLVVADKEFDYKEEDQFYQVEADGIYIISAYGAQGGNSGGKGGYVKAEIPLQRGDTLIINTGGINGYNGGGAYKNSNYVPGGGATTIRYNDEYVVIAAGGGAKGNSNTPGDGGSGDGSGGSDVGTGAGIPGSNGGGGSNSLNHNYESCVIKGGEPYDCCKIMDDHPDNPHCSLMGTCYTMRYTVCTDKTNNGKSGTGGSNSVVVPASIIENVSGNRDGNGYVKIMYKI